MKLMERIKSFLFSRQMVQKDIFETDCLVGIVKNKFQLEVNLTNKFYHVPAELIYALDLPIDYVALYMSVKTFGRKNAGILYYGKIIKTSVHPRNAIKSIPKESDEPYFVFQVDEWKTLDKPILPLEVINIVTMTSLGLIKRSEYMAELYIRSWEEYRLFQFLKAICIDNTDKKKYNYNGTKIGVSGDAIELIYKNGERRKLSKGDYINKPFKLFRKIKVHEDW